MRLWTHTHAPYTVYMCIHAPYIMYMCIHVQHTVYMCIHAYTLSIGEWNLIIEFLAEYEYTDCISLKTALHTVCMNARTQTHIHIYRILYTVYVYVFIHTVCRVVSIDMQQVYSYSTQNSITNFHSPKLNVSVNDHLYGGDVYNCPQYFTHWNLLVVQNKFTAFLMFRDLICVSAHCNMATCVSLTAHCCTAVLQLRQISAGIELYCTANWIGSYPANVENMVTQ